MTIKKMVAGNGRADKTAVQQSVRKFLGPAIRKKKGKKTHFDNEADALAVALCHLFTYKDKIFIPELVGVKGVR
jgi:Holliday junction resolvasome RuvABC endonuclease subunit